EADDAAVGAAHVLAGTHDHRTVNVALFDASPRLRFLDRHHDDVADAGKTTLRPAQHLDALDALCAAIVRDVEIGLHLDHRSGSFLVACRDAPGSSKFVTTRCSRRPRLQPRGRPRSPRPCRPGRDRAPSTSWSW